MFIVFLLTCHEFRLKFAIFSLYKERRKITLTSATKGRVPPAATTSTAGRGRRRMRRRRKKDN